MLCSRTIPGYLPHPLSPIPEHISDPDDHPSSSTLHPPDNFHVDHETIRKMEEDLGKIKLTIKKDPTSKNWVSFKSIEHFPEEED